MKGIAGERKAGIGKEKLNHFLQKGQTKRRGVGGSAYVQVENWTTNFQFCPLFSEALIPVEFQDSDNTFCKRIDIE